MATGTARAGDNGLVMIDVTSAGTTNATLVSSVSTWKFSQDRDFYNTTSMGDSVKTSVAGLANATGSLGGTWDAADNNRYNILGSSVERAVRIYPDYTNNVTTYVYGKAFFSGDFSGGVGDAVKADLTFQAGPTGMYWAHP